MRHRVAKRGLTGVCTAYRLSTMTTTRDNVLVTVADIVEQFGVSPGAVRAWIAAGVIKPVRREGRGRSGTMFFARGEVANIVYGLCPVCGNGFKRTTRKQKFCGRICRQRSARLSKPG